jgi:transaldolase
MNRLRRLSTEFGQSPWLDNLRRDWIQNGDLAALRDRGVRGVTSNPTIFQKAIQGSSAYAEQIGELRRSAIETTDLYWALVVRDIHDALEVFAPVHESSGGADGFVSVEVDPRLARDGTATLAAARELHERINRPNVMIKIPATVESLPAITAMISEGRSVNVTLIFSLERYQMVMNAYIAGLEARLAAGVQDLSTVSGVGSFFISRVDTEIDRRLHAAASTEADDLCGTAAIAQARIAYSMFCDTFSGDRWDHLAAHGARVQRPLWASTSTKNPAYRDTLYVDELIAPDTVNTLPDATLEAFDQHGTLARTIDDTSVESARQIWAAISEAGVDVIDVATVLERDGLASFEQSFVDLLAVLDAR